MLLLREIYLSADIIVNLSIVEAILVLLITGTAGFDQENQA
jgi:hypothetical protein